MKKTYIQPNIILVKTNLENTILAASNPGNFDGGLDNKGVDAGSITSKKNRGLTNLWDESWEIPEEEEE